MDLLVSDTFPLEDASTVYGRLRAGELSGIGFLFEYARSVDEPSAVPWSTGPAPRARPAGRGEGAVRVGFIGAGNYATSMLLPHLAARQDIDLACVATTTPLSAANATRRFGFEAAVTDVDALLDSDVDAVFVVTRHNSHADLVCRALAAGKATFVEKPLCLNDDELSRILSVAEASGNERLMVGFNRRFAPLLRELRQRFGGPTDGAVVRYLVNAGPLATSSWYRDEKREGSRFVGEGGHFLDTLSWWLDARPLKVSAVGTGSGDLHVVVSYDDGSIGTVDYVTDGCPRYPKETMDVSAGGWTARLDNFTRATLWHGRSHRTLRARGSVDKGQKGQLSAFVEAVRTGGPMPIPLESLVSTTAATIAAARSLESGATVAL